LCVQKYKSLEEQSEYKKRGRKTKNTEGRTERIDFRVTTEQKEFIAFACEKLGMSQADLSLRAIYGLCIQNDILTDSEVTKFRKIIFKKGK
jgi:uncharacterized protein (DUF1778 family)